MTAAAQPVLALSARLAALARMPLVLSTLAVGASLLGLASQLTQVRAFGATTAMDVYLTILAVPSLFTGVLPAAASALVVPMLASAEREGWQAEAEASVFRASLGAGALVLVVGALIAPAVAAAVAKAHGTDEATVQMAAVLLWAMVAVFVVSSALAAVDQATDRYAATVVGPLLTPLFTIGCILIFRARLGTASIALGLFVGAVMQGALVTSTLRRAAAALRKGLRRPLTVPLAACVPTVLALFPFAGFPAVTAAVMIHSPPGTLTTLSQGHSVAAMLSTAASYGVALVALRGASRALASGEREDAVDQSLASTRTVVAAAAVAGAILWGVGGPFLRLLFLGGAFDAAAVAQLQAILPWFVLGGVAIAALNVLRTFFFAEGSALRFGFVGLAVTGGYGFAALVVRDSLGATGVAAAYATSWVIFALIAARALASRATHPVRSSMTFCGALMFRGAVVGTAAYAAASAADATRALWALVAGVLTGLAAAGVLQVTPFASSDLARFRRRRPGRELKGFE